MAAKIRGVKPEYWTDEDIIEVSRDARLLYIGMWAFACDNGHLDDKPKQIKLRVFPADDDTDVPGWLKELEAHGRIVRDSGTITIPKFAEHQKPHKSWWKTCGLPYCNRPAPEGKPSPNSGPTVEPQAGNSSPPAEVEVEVDCEGECDDEGEEAKKETATTQAPRKRGTRIPEDFALTESMIEWAKKKGYGSVDLPASVEAFFDYWVAVPGAKGVKLDWEATWRNRVRDQAQRPAWSGGKQTPKQPNFPSPAENRAREAAQEAADIAADAAREANK